jgi:hypothetical protein
VGSNKFLRLQSGENPLYHAIFSPSLKPPVDRVPVPEFVGQSPPFATVFGHIEYGCDECEVVDFHVPALSRKIWRYALKLFPCNIHDPIIP